MRNIACLFLASILTLFVTVAHADDKKAANAMKVGDAIALRDALKAATGLHDEIIGQHTSTQTVTRQLYDIDSNARWNMNDDTVALNAALAGIDADIKQLRDDAVAKNGNMPFPEKVTDQTAAQQAIMKKFNDDLAALMARSVDSPTLTHVKRGDFKEAMPGEVIVPMEQAGIIDR